jgi:endoglycosylceramidase
MGPAIVDSLGRTRILHGVNVSNAAKYFPGHLSWHGPQDYTDLAATGIDSVRLLTFWAALMPTEGVIDDAYIEAYAQRVDWAHQAGLLVIVDMHQDLFGEGFAENGAPRWACDEALYASYVPSQPWYVNYLDPGIKACFDRFYADDALFGRFRDAWVAVATRLKDHPGVVGFDLLNEPYWGSTAADEWVSGIWQPRMEQLTEALHAIAPNRLVFFQGTTLSSLGNVDPFVPFADPDVVFAPHYYHPLVHDGTPYDPSMEDLLDVAMDGIGQMDGLLGNVPVWVGEFGGPTGIDGFQDYLAALLTRFAARQWSWAYYSDDRSTEDAFGIRNPDGSFKWAVVDRLAHPCARAVPGPILEQSFDPVIALYQARFRWQYEAPLELWIGREGAVEVVIEPEGESGAPIACKTGGLPGIRICPDGTGTKPSFGEVYRIRIGPAGISSSSSARRGSGSPS